MSHATPGQPNASYVAREALFVVHVYPDGRREVVELHSWTIELRQEPEWNAFGRPRWTALPTERTVTVQGRMGQGIFYDPGQAPDFTPQPQSELEPAPQQIEP